MSLVAYYTLNDTTIDSGNNGLDGTATDITYTSGKIQNAGQFNGSSSRIEIASSTSFDFASGFSICYWAKPSVFNQHTRVMYRYASPRGFYTGQYNNGKWNFCIFGSNGGQTIYSDAISTSEWQHIAVIRTNDGTMLMYVNGILQAQTGTSTGTINCTASVFIGCDLVPSQFFSGLIDDVRIYDEVLTEQQILSLYNNTTLPIIAHYKLDGNSNDSSANLFHGTDTSIIYNEGKINTSAYFNGSTSCIDCDDPVALRLTTWTISAWVKSDRVSTNAQKYWFIANRGSIYSAGFGIEFYDHPTTPQWEVWSRGASLKILSSQVGSGNIAVWNHIVGMCNGTTLYLCVNNGQILSGAGVAASTTAGNNFRIGDDNRSDAGGLLWNGNIDDVRVYDTVLTAEQISQIYNNGRGIEEELPIIPAILNNCTIKNLSLV